MVDFDKYARELQFSSIVDKELQSMSDHYLSMLEAYSEGINKYAMYTTLPLEFWIMNINFQQWTIKDSLMIFKSFSFELADNWKWTILRTKLKGRIGEKLAEILLPGNNVYYNNTIFSDINTPDELEEIKESIKLRTMEGMVGTAGNSWVIHGNYTKTHKPILSNDLSKLKQIPGEFYLTTLKYSNKTITGATIIGLPLILIGSNKNISWAFTPNKVNTISVLEAPSLTNTRGTIINVKGKNSIAYLLYSTSKGHVITKYA